MTLDISTTLLQPNLRYAQYPSLVDAIAPQTPAGFVRHAAAGSERAYQPRARHSARCGRSTPSVVSAPCPG